jgi:starvation-inducible DNA-binding protein
MFVDRDRNPRRIEAMMNQTRNDLPESVRRKMAELLNARLADMIDLGLQAKQAHWNVKGSSFIALHELFDQVAGAAHGWADDFAERAVQLGGTAAGTLQSVARASTLPPYPDRDHVASLSAALAAAGKATRKAIDDAAEAGDAVTADLFTEVTAGIDKQLWFVEAHLQG